MTQSNPCIALVLLLFVSVLLTSSGAVPLDNGNIKDAVKDHLDGGNSYGPIEGWDMSSVTSMDKLFHCYSYSEPTRTSCYSFNDDIQQWHVSNVTSMKYVFGAASSFDQDVSNWDVSKVTNMDHMFWSASSFNKELNNWDVSNVLDMDSMFSDALAFNQNLNNWDVSKVTMMYYMFRGASTFNQEISNWHVSNVDDMSYVFDEASSFNQELNNWDVSNVEDMSNMFSGATSFDQDLNDWDVSNVEWMSEMFYGATSFDKDLNDWDVSKVEYMSYMFEEATSFDQDLDYWDVSNVSNMNSMFSGATSFDQDLNNWDVSKVTNMKYMFYEAVSFDQELCWDISGVSYIDHMFDGSSGSIAPYPQCLAPPVIPFQIVSSLSEDSDKQWCIVPKSNNLNAGAKLVINECKSWESFFWQIDNGGQIKNHKDLSLCIQLKNRNIRLETCVNGMKTQRWLYSMYGKRILSANNGVKGAVAVVGGVASSDKLIKLLEYGDVKKYESWDFKYMTPPGGIVTVPDPNEFKIVSVSNSFCLYPTQNTLQAGKRLTTVSCKDWKPYKWTMDDEGKLHNVKDNSLCLEIEGRSIRIQSCQNGFTNQRWAYSIMDKTLVSLRRGTRAMSWVVGTGIMKLQDAESPVPLRQQWTLLE